MSNIPDILLIVSSFEREGCFSDDEVIRDLKNSFNYFEREEECFGNNLSRIFHKKDNFSDDED